MEYRVNSLPNENFWTGPNSKHNADDKSNAAKIVTSVFEGLKHCGICRKCWCPAFSHFLTMFSKGFFHRVVKSWDCVVKS